MLSGGAGCCEGWRGTVRGRVMAGGAARSELVRPRRLAADGHVALAPTRGPPRSKPLADLALPYLPRGARLTLSCVARRLHRVVSIARWRRRCGLELPFPLTRPSPARAILVARPSPAAPLSTLAANGAGLKLTALRQRLLPLTSTLPLSPSLPSFVPCCPSDAGASRTPLPRAPVSSRRSPLHLRSGLTPTPLDPSCSSPFRPFPPPSFLS